MSTFDAIVVGSGPNGLAAAITLARAGLSVKIFEANDTIGGGVRSAQLTLPDFYHDTCSTVYPIAAVSPFFRSLPQSVEMEWIFPEASVAHPLDDGTAVVLHDNLDRTAEHLGSDGTAWKNLFAPYVNSSENFLNDLLRPLPFIPHHPFLMSRFGLQAIQSARGLSNRYFTSERTKALFAGISGHSFLPFEQSFSAATAMVLTVAAHKSGWPIVKGGAGKISEALGNYFQSLGGKIETGVRVTSLEEFSRSKIVMLDVTVRNLISLLKDTVSSSYTDKLARFRPGMAAYKIDWALSHPVPWKAKECLKAATIHLGGTFDEIAESERLVADGRVSEKPFVLLTQPTVFDPTRCPIEKHILWAYCHLPINSTIDMTSRIEDQIERFAPGFKDCIIEKRITTPKDLEHSNINYVGGDISGGAMDWPQIFQRPTSFYNSYKTPVANLYLCSASTPPGPGVHGMSGYHAAHLALRENS